ncbi:MAG: arylsulfatase [Bacteroidota bacterium]|nr:arylsulfatase [Bacteroidota bacterium]
MKYILTITIFFFFSAKLLAQKNPGKPNIIVILADDLGYGDTGCYGQKKIATPNIDRLAKMGVKFTQFYAGTAVCAPSRSSFMTGLHTGHTAIRGNKPVPPEGQVPLPDSIITFPMLLQNAGYATAAFGKWSLGFITSSGDPQKKGFAEFYGYNCQTLAHNYYPDHLWHNHDRVDLGGNLKYDSVYSADLIHRQAMNFLKATHDKPFFLYLPYTLPHADVIVPRDSVYNYYVRKFNEKPVAIPKSTDKEKHHFDPYPHAAFAAMVARLDKYVGEIMKVLKEKGMEENTLIIFTSDNGPHKENGGDPAFFNSNGNLTGIKRDLYEGGIRVPFIAYQKGITKAGTVNDMPCALWDLYPTFLQMANMPASKGIDGISILPALEGKNQNRLQYLYWELHEAGGKQAIRMGDWKAIRLNVSNDPGSPVELYNLAKDPQEKNNIAALYPAIVKQMESLMKQAHVSDKDWPLLPGEPK